MIRTCRRYASQIPQTNGPKPVPKPVDKLSPAEQLKAVDQRPPGLLDRLFTRIDNSRKEAEKAHIDRVNAGQKTRVNSAMMDKVGDYFDPEVQAKKRQELLSKAFEKGYWQDAREILKLGAKLWEAPNRLKPIKTCIEIPPIQGKLMSGETMNARKYTSLNSVTLVGIYFNAFGEVS
jgi:ATP10 protein